MQNAKHISDLTSEHTMSTHVGSKALFSGSEVKRDRWDRRSHGTAASSENSRRRGKCMKVFFWHEEM